MATSSEPGASSRKKDGSFRSIQEIGRTLFACGYGAQLYKRADDGWQPIVGGMRDQSRMRLDRQFGLGSFANQERPDSQEQMRLGKESLNFNSVDGSGENDIYVCGLNGVIAHHNGTELGTLESPTGEHLLDIHCVSLDRIITSCMPWLGAVILIKCSRSDGNHQRIM